jgi:hypothetical protein
MQLDPVKQRIDRIRMEAKKFAAENGQSARFSGILSGRVALDD